MRVLILWAEPWGTNLGVRALAAGTAALVHRTWPDAEISYQGYGPGDAPMRVGSRRNLMRQYVRPRSVLKQWLRTFDVVFDTRAGDSFSDAYGLHRHYGMTTLSELVTSQDVPVVLAPQTIGPFDTVRGRLLARRTLRRAAAVMARDTASAQYAAAIGRPVDVCTTDVVFAIEQPPVTEHRDVVLNVSGLLWQDNPHVPSASYRRTVLEVCRTLLAEGRQVTLLAHVLDSFLADNDVPAVRAVEAELAAEGKVVDVVVPDSLDCARAVLGSAEIVVGSRMHACLNALSAGTPAIPLAYSRKFAPLLADLGWTHGVDLRTAREPVAELVAAMRADDLAGQVSALRDRAAASLTAADRLLAGLGARWRT